MVMRGIATLIDWTAVLVVWVSVGILMPPTGCARLLWELMPVRARWSRPAAS
jgi:hypothetical protein